MAAAYAASGFSRTSEPQKQRWLAEAGGARSGPGPPKRGARAAQDTDGVNIRPNATASAIARSHPMTQTAIARAVLV